MDSKTTIFANKIFLSPSLSSVLFFLKDSASKYSTQLLVSILFYSAILLILFVFFYDLLASFPGDVKSNPRPNLKPNEALSVCHWNLRVSLLIISLSSIL